MSVVCMFILVHGQFNDHHKCLLLDVCTKNIFDALEFSQCFLSIPQFTGWAWSFPPIRIIWKHLLCSTRVDSACKRKSCCLKPLHGVVIRTLLPLVTVHRVCLFLLLQSWLFSHFQHVLKVSLPGVLMVFWKENSVYWFMPFKKLQYAYLAALATVDILFCGKEF